MIESILTVKASIRISPAGRGSSMNFTARSATVSLPTRSGNALPLNARISGTRVRRPTVRLERKRIEESVRRYVAGRDTLGLWASYDRKYHRTASFWPMYRLERELTADRVPSKFRDLYNGGAQPVQHTQLCPHRHRFDGHLPPPLFLRPDCRK